MTEYKNIRVKEVDYGFGYVMIGDTSTLTIDNVLTNLDYQFKQLREQNKIMREALSNLVEKTEYGVNQWQLAFAPDEETEAQRAIKTARQALKEIDK